MPIMVPLRWLSPIEEAAGLAPLASVAFAEEGAWAVQDMLQAIAVIRTAERMTDGIALKLLD
jgi:hypothetical protein